MAQTKRHVLIAGAGAFGLSTAWHLLKTDSYEVTLLERAKQGLAADAASFDLNKIVRSDYADFTYAKLAKEAIDEWKKPEWEGTYHESGVLLVGDTSATGVYADASLENCKRLGSRVEILSDKAVVAACFPPTLSVGSFESLNTYLNRDGGWAEASAALELLASMVRKLGGKILNDSRITGLAKNDMGEVDGLQLESGSSIHADIVVVACGSWTTSIFPEPEFGISSRLLATGQSLATMQLSAEEAEPYRSTPVILDFATGWYVFPPNKDNVVKISIHHAGHVNPQTLSTNPSAPAVSTPITAVDGGADGYAIPVEMARDFRRQLKHVYPELGKKPFNWTRLCWYTDTPDSDWLIDFHPDHPRLLFATGGSGHAFKFLPTLGALVRTRIEGTMEAELKVKFSWTKSSGKADKSRLGQTVKILKLDELVTPEDLRSD